MPIRETVTQDGHAFGPVRLRHILTEERVVVDDEVWRRERCKHIVLQIPQPVEAESRQIIENQADD